ELAAGLAADARGASGPAGAGIKSLQRGRAFASRSGLPRGGARLNLIDTLRAAAPWQPLRRDASGDGDSPVPQLKLAKSDLRIYRRRDTSETLAIFVVDASGSSAAERLAEAKGAVELLLGQTYARRDQVALVAVRGTEAQVLLPPTRSLTRAKRLLAGLPGGGGTPLASGLEAGLQLAAMAKRRGQSPMMIALTDGQANIDRTGQPGRPAAFADAIAAARGIRGTRLSAIVIDTSQRPQPRAREIADAMGARYLPLPRADAAGVAAAVGGIAESVARP
ncbi:MAG: VWA domain-containing protein, partial [Pseudomonadota bacterium]